MLRESSIIKIMNEAINKRLDYVHVQFGAILFSIFYNDQEDKRISATVTLA